LAGELRRQQRVFECDFVGRAAVLKHRFEKTYRHEVLDKKLTRTRLVAEARATVRARKEGVRVPALLFCEAATGTLVFERICGQALKHVVDAEGASPRVLGLLRELGKIVARLHDADLIHGDLTTSNVLVETAPGGGEETGERLVMIDFGLSTNSKLAEDKGVDLYVMERAFTSAHARHGELFEHVLESYKRSTTRWSSTFNKFAEVRMRGRKRTMIG